MIEFPFRHCILLRLRRSSFAENWSCLDLFCIMVSLCGDFILRSRALKAQVNTLLFASLHIHEGHRGIRCSFFFFFFPLFRSVVGITRCACEFCLFLCVICSASILITVSRHYRFLMRPLREPKLGHPYPCCFSSSHPTFSSLQHVDIVSSALLPTFSSLCIDCIIPAGAFLFPSHLDSHTPIVFILSVSSSFAPPEYFLHLPYLFPCLSSGLMQTASSFIVVWSGLWRIPKEREGEFIRFIELC